jgi:rod shape-determining protein MreD
MSMLVAAVGALLAALLETSVLSELSIAGVKPDLVFALAIVVAMLVGFEDSLVWALVGGLFVDALAGRPLGATALALLIVTGMAALLSRVTGAPRALTVGLATLVLTWLFQAVLLAILSITAGIAMASISVQLFLIIAVMNGILALLAVVVTRALYRRFGAPERVDW